MARRYSIALLLCLAAYGQSSSSTARRFIGTGSTLPTTCNSTTSSVDVYARFTGGVATMYYCSAPNTWTAFGTGSGSGSVTSVATDGTSTCGGPITTTGTITVCSSAAFTGTPTIGTAPSLTDQSGKVPTTGWVQGLLSTFNPAISVQAVCISNVTATYNNGTAGVGATLTSPSATTLTCDGYSVQNGDAILFNGQTSSFQNGVYDCVISGSPFVCTRDTSFNTAANINGSGAIPVLNGTVDNNTLGILNNAITTIGTDAITYTLIPNTSVSNAKTPRVVTFNISGGGSTITTGALNTYVESEIASTSGIYKVVTTGTATSGPANCSITVDIWKRNAALPTSSQKISASAPATLSTAQYSVDTTLTGWSKKVNTGDVWSASVASVTSCITATVQIWWK